jgi:hypothetical protein
MIKAASALKVAADTWPCPNADPVRAALCT